MMLDIKSRLYINGHWQDAVNGITFTDINPATGEVLAEVASGQAEDIDRAVEAASNAFYHGPWGHSTPRERSQTLFRLSQLIRRDREILARIEALDVGKRLPDALEEIDLCANLFEYYAGAIDKFLGESYRPEFNKWAVVLREPIGIVAGIVPWNYPLPLGTLKVAPALAMGNTIVLKPAEQAPLSNIYLAALADEAGIPPGVFNVVPGLGEIAGEALINHHDVRVIAFTGSTEVGKKIMRAASSRIARVELELGGKSPQIVFPDADLDAAADGITLGLFKNAGQDCCAGSRILVHQDVYNDLTERLVAIARRQKIGNPLETGITMGPVITLHQRERIHGYIEDALGHGARLLTGGRPIEDVPDGASFYEPTLIDNVPPQHRAFQEEIFGPVGVLTVFDSEDQAVELANATPYGLASAIWTQSLGVAMRVASQLQVGMVWVNEYYAHVMGLPFGGHKTSGVGHDYSLHALEAYTQLKEVTFRFPSAAH